MNIDNNLKDRSAEPIVNRNDWAKEFFDNDILSGLYLAPDEDGYYITNFDNI